MSYVNRFEGLPALLKAAEEGGAREWLDFLAAHPESTPGSEVAAGYHGALVRTLDEIFKRVEALERIRQ